MDMDEALVRAFARAMEPFAAVATAVDALVATSAPRRYVDHAIVVLPERRPVRLVRPDGRLRAVVGRGWAAIRTGDPLSQLLFAEPWGDSGQDRLVELHTSGPDGIDTRGIVEIAHLAEGGRTVFADGPGAEGLGLAGVDFRVVPEPQGRSAFVRTLLELSARSGEVCVALRAARGAKHYHVTRLDPVRLRRAMERVACDGVPLEPPYTGLAGVIAMCRGRAVPLPEDVADDEIDAITAPLADVLREAIIAGSGPFRALAAWPGVVREGPLGGLYVCGEVAAAVGLATRVAVRVDRLPAHLSQCEPVVLDVPADAPVRPGARVICVNEEHPRMRHLPPYRLVADRRTLLRTVDVLAEWVRRTDTSRRVDEASTAAVATVAAAVLASHRPGRSGRMLVWEIPVALDVVHGRTTIATTLRRRR